MKAVVQGYCSNGDVVAAFKSSLTLQEAALDGFLSNTRCHDGLRHLYPPTHPVPLHSGDEL